MNHTDKPLRPFFVLWTGQALSLLGSQAVQFALIWWLTARTGSATVLAGATFVGLLPRIVLGPFIGALVDRWNRKRVMLLADATVAAASAVLALLFLRGNVTPSHVLALIFVRALGEAFHQPAMLASTSLMVPSRHLTRIQGLNQGLEGGALIVTAPLGALLFAMFPMAGVMAVDLLTALFAIVPLVFIVVPQPEASADAASSGARARWRDMIDGVRYLRSRPGHGTLLSMSVLINLCMVPAFALLPLLVVRYGGGAADFGWLSSLFGVGTIAGGVALGVWGGFKSRMHTTLAGLIVAGIATMVLGSATTSGMAIAGILGVGASVSLANGPIRAVLQATIAPQFQGRVFSLYGSACTAMAPLGLAVAAPVADLFGVRAWYAAGGIACVALGVLGFFLPSLARIEEAAEADTPAEVSSPVMSAEESR